MSQLIYRCTCVLKTHIELEVLACCDLDARNKIREGEFLPLADVPPEYELIDIKLRQESCQQ